MKELTEAEIRKMLEEQSDVAGHQLDSQDIGVYEVIFTALNEAPTGGLPMDFSNRVGDLALNNALRKESRLKLLVQWAVAFGALALSALILWIFQPGFASQFHATWYELRWIITFSLVMFIGVQAADYIFLKRRKYRGES